MAHQARNDLPENLSAGGLDLQSRARSLVKELASGCANPKGAGWFTPAIYDTAWLSMIIKPGNGTPKLLFPDCMTYILDMQSERGGWDTNSEPIDKVLNTLAALLSLLKYHSHCPESNLQSRIEDAKTALAIDLKDWDVKNTVHVGFEILVPSLLEQLEEYGIVFDFPQKKYLMALNAKKLAKFPLSLIYSEVQTTLLHSLEAFVRRVDFDRTKHQLRNGSMLGSPSSTAAYLMYSSTWDEDAEAYLRTVYERANFHGGVPSAFPSAVFESSWVGVLTPVYFPLATLRQCRHYQRYLQLALPSGIFQEMTSKQSLIFCREPSNCNPGS